MTQRQARQSDELRRAMPHCAALGRESALGDFPVYLDHSVVVPPRSILRVSVGAPAVTAGKATSGALVISRDSRWSEKTGLLSPAHIVASVDENGQTFSTVLNPTDRHVRVEGRVRYGMARRACEPEQQREYPWRVIASLNEHDASTTETIAQQPKLATDATPSTEWLTKEFRLDQSPYLQSADRLALAIALLKDFPSLYSDGTVLGRTTLIEHAIHLQHPRPVAIRPRRVNPKYREAEQEQIKEWKKQGIIEDSNSAYSFPMIPVPKKDGTVRFCIDYRKLNEITYKDAYPLPLIEDNLAQLKDSTVFSALDNVGAFHSVPVREQDRHKTAFSSSEGLYQFLYLPFGLMNGPPTYSRLVKLVLKDIPLSVALPYLDDCCVHSVDFQSHVEGLRRVFRAYERAGLKLKPSKCMLFMDSITYLGHEVSKDGIQIATRYVDIVRNWPEPETRAEIRTFIGKVGYYRKFIPAYSAEVEPLQSYLRDVPENEMKAPLAISEEARAAFIKLKQLLCQSPILAYPDFKSGERFILDTDWSLDNKMIGGVLSQVQDGQERVIAYSARRLRKPEQKGRVAGYHYVRESVETISDAEEVSDANGSQSTYVAALHARADGNSATLARLAGQLRLRSPTSRGKGSWQCRRVVTHAAHDRGSRIAAGRALCGGDPGRDRCISSGYGCGPNPR